MWSCREIWVLRSNLFCNLAGVSAALLAIYLDSLWDHTISRFVTWLKEEEVIDPSTYELSPIKTIYDNTGIIPMQQPIMLSINRIVVLIATSCTCNMVQIIISTPYDAVYTSDNSYQCRVSQIILLLKCPKRRSCSVADNLWEASFRYMNIIAT